MSDYDPNKPMTMPDPGGDLDADVVCQQCGMVNEPGTLMCKQCGNNLRDQKRTRLASGHDEIPAETVDRRKILSGMLSVFGILVCIYVALNVDTIVGGAAEVDNSGPNFEGLWSGSIAGELDLMAASLRDYPPSAADVQNAIASTAPAATVEGRYVIREEASVDNSIIGFAEVRLDGEDIIFVAVMDGGWEVRGRGSLESDDRATAAQISVRSETDQLTGYGIAKRNAQEAFTLIGMVNETSQQVRYIAHAIPY